MTSKKNIGAELKTHSAAFAVQGIVPLAATVARTSATIDRLGYDSAVIVTSVGATTGTPDSFSVNTKLTHSDAESSGFVDVTDEVVPEIAAVNLTKSKNVNLRGCKRYLRIVETPAFVGGTTPTVACASLVILGGADVLPAA